MMTKRPVHFAFGYHGDTYTKRGMDHNFFRGAVVPFVEDQLSNSKKVAIIYESVIHIPLCVRRPIHTRINERGQLDGHALQAFQRSLKQMEESTNRHLSAVIKTGSRDVYLKATANDRELNSVVNWGFEFDLLDMVSSNPGSILAFLEPQNHDTMISSWKLDPIYEKLEHLHSLPWESRMDLVQSFIESLSQFIIRRDKAVKSLVERLFEEGIGAVVIPRGASHQGMLHLFDPATYEISVDKTGIPPGFVGSVDKTGLPYGFAGQALTRSYQRKLSEDEIRLFAELEIEYRDLLSQLPSKIGLILQQYPSDYRPQLVASLPEFAKTEVIRQNQQTAKKLGLC